MSEAFGSLNHDWVLRFVAHRVGDPRLISLIRRWLKAGVLEDGKVYPSEAAVAAMKSPVHSILIKA
jgi:retron-type reverse transcriptase